MNADPNARDKMLNDLSSTLTQASEPIADTPPAPPVIPDHELIRRVGRGSYGEVWLARNALGTWRAVKIVQRAAFDHDRPYEREFEGIRRFEPISRTHPSQLNVLHVGRNDAAGHFYYVMELADAAVNPKLEIRNPKEARNPNAETIAPDAEVRVSAFGLPSGFGLRDSDLYQPRTLRSDLYHHGRLPFDECLQIGLALATALDHLHRHGLVHRDIKPSNIVFVNGIPKLADIGLVARAEATLSLVGTEGYLPPEGPGTAQADIYSLGKVLYEMATGRDRQQFPELPTNLIQQPAAERAQLAELNEIILRACHTDLKQRYETAAELHAELALLQSGKSVSRMRTVERRVRTLARAGALVTAVAVLAGGGWLWQQQQTREARRLAIENARLGEENRQRIVRLDVANGVRLLDDGDSTGALLWFADALPLVTNNHAEASVHRIRIQQVLNQTPRLLQVLPHDSGLVSSAFSPDGRFVATGTSGGTLNVWDAGSGDRVWGTKPMASRMRYVRFSRDGSRLFVSSSRHQWWSRGEVPGLNAFAVLETETGREIFPAEALLPNMTSNLIYSTFSPDDRWLAVSLQDTSVRVFDLREGLLVTTIRGHTNSVVFLSFSADGSLLATAGEQDRTARVWRLPSGDPVGSPLEHSMPVARAILTDDGCHLITGAFANPDLGGECEIQAWNVGAGQRLGDSIKGRDGLALFVEPGAGGRFFGRVDGSADNRTHVWSFDLEAKKLPPLEIAWSQCWAFSPDGKRLALGGDDHTARIFSLESGELLAGPFRHNRWVHAVQFSPDGNRLLTASDDGNVRIWNLTSRPSELAKVRVPAGVGLGPAETLTRQGLSPGPFLANSDPWRLIDPEQLAEVAHLISPRKGEQLAGPLEGNTGRFWVLHSVIPGEKHPTRLHLWCDDRGQLRQFTLDHPGGLGEYAFSPDDKLLVSYGREGVIRFWRTIDGKLERSIEVPRSKGGYLAAISPDIRIAIWHRVNPNASGGLIEWLDLDSGEIIAGPHTVSGARLRFEFSPDGARLALGDYIGSVTLMDGRNGQLISSTIKHTGNLAWVEWSPDSRRLLTAGYNEETLIWDATTGVQLLV